MSNLAASLPAPTPLRRGLRIHYQWGEQKFDIIASACSIRTALWDETSEEVTWLHCKAVQTLAIKPDGSGDAMNVLIPVAYITRVEAGPTFRVARSRKSGDLGIFPPNQPPPQNTVSLAELDRIIGELVDVSLN